MIKVVNKKVDNYDKNAPYVCYIGRPSRLGNRFATKPSKFPGTVHCESLEQSLMRFRLELKQALLPNMIRYNSPYLDKMRDYFFELYNMWFIYDNLILECWCKPSPCHGDIIKEFLEKYEKGGLNEIFEKDLDKILYPVPMLEIENASDIQKL